MPASTLICPGCDGELVQITVGGVVLDACLNGCGGIWFDQLELQKFDEPHEHAGDLLMRLHGTEGAVVDYTRKRRCPRCPDAVMMRHYFSAERRVVVDECPSCGGFWLDAGELARLRQEVKDRAERLRTAQNVLRRIANEDLMRMRQKGADEARRADRLGQVFDFLAPGLE